MMKKGDWRLEVSYDGEFELDDVLDKVVGRKGSDFSGAGFGARDVGWYFKKADAAIEKFNAVIRLKDKRILSVTLSIMAEVE